MSDLIKRSDLLRILEVNEPMNWCDTDAEIRERACWHWFNKIVEDLPAVDAVEVVRHGEWEFGELDMMGATVKCSVCGFSLKNVDPVLWLKYPAHKFRGCCGAKMDGRLG